jgi:hypothetical protein
MFNFLQKESEKGRLLSETNPNYLKAKSHGIRALEPLAVTWIRRPRNSRLGLIHSPLLAGIIGLSSIRQYKTFMMIKPSLDLEEEQLSLSANWGDNITKIVPASISDNDVTGNVLGIVSLAKAKSLGLIFDNQDAREPYASATRTHKWSMPAIPTKFISSSKETEASTEESNIPVLVVIPKTLIVEFRSEILSGKVIYKDAMACLQALHKNAAIIGSAWDFLQHKFNSKSIHVAPDFQWACLDRTFTEKAKSLVQENLLMSHLMIRPDSMDYKVIKVKESKAIQEAINSYLAENPAKRQAPNQQTQTQGQAQGQPETPINQNVDPRNKKTWEIMFCAMQSVSTEKKAKNLETSKYAIAFFKILMMLETTENDMPNNGQTSKFEVTDINRLLKAGISAKLKNMNTWNMQKEHFQNAMAEKDNLPYQNLKPLLLRIPRNHPTRMGIYSPQDFLPALVADSIDRWQVLTTKAPLERLPEWSLVPTSKTGSEGHPLLCNTTRKTRLANRSNVMAVNAYPKPRCIEVHVPVMPWSKVITLRHGD